MSAYDSLMSKSRSAKKRRRVNNSVNATTASLQNNKGGSRFFPCPAGCGMHVSERDVNAHLDSECPQLKCNCDNEGDDKSGEEHDAAKKIEESTEAKAKATAISGNNALQQSTAKAKPNKCTNSNTNNAFQHMMKNSAQVYSNNGNIQQRFHLHNDQGMVSWTCEDDDNTGADGGFAKSDHINIQDSDIQWSATILLKKAQTIYIYEHGEQQAQVQERSIQLTVSSSIPPFSAHQSTQQAAAAATTSITKPKLPQLIQRHSHLSISHLKSCLQKSIRRRAPLPAVRVAMELADKSWTDLIRRLPIIVLEDSTLHPDFGLLVWLMIADSKGYLPSKELIVRVLQIVFEMASCPWQDVIAEHSNDDSSGSPTKDSTCSIESGSGNKDNTPTSFSLSSSSSTLFPRQQHKEQTSTKVCETMIRAMLLRAQYGGMKCDVDMLHSFAKIWLQRFHGVHAVPTTIGPNSSISDKLSWNCIPFFIHSNARQQSQTLVTMSMFNSPGGVVALTTNDVCPAGIDFHCSQVVEHLLSRPYVYSCVCERLKPPNSEINRDWIASKVKQCIWNYSSGVNRRRTLIGSAKQSDCASVLKGLWDDVLTSPFDDYVNKFVKDRLHVGASQARTKRHEPQRSRGVEE